ncbi:MAG: 16S rRNA (guanine(966)-N(2))-methyltransferase RsmD [Oscillospiraceae bacterium]|nr:16S rRNA (guanine(966)-N(2))-methyltransferase RsmD [Oscillospiraceae bacterium]
MRIITGTAKGRRLKEPKNYDIRPTTDMVKEAIFSIVQFDVEGRRVLDLFGGTGQLGLEAASRGAAEVVITDSSRESIKLIRENAAHCALNVKIVQTDAIGWLARCGRFDLIFIDPPYDSPLAEKSLKTIKEFDILSEGGIIICETRCEKSLPELEPPYKKGREYRYGKVKLTAYSKEAMTC